MDEFEIQMQNVKPNHLSFFFISDPKILCNQKNTHKKNQQNVLNFFLSKTLLISFSQAKDKKTESENQTKENSEIKTENTDATDSAATDNANDNDNENDDENDDEIDDENENATNDTSVAATS